jgi:3-isopropylmalate dehydratase small subunit
MSSSQGAPRRTIRGRVIKLDRNNIDTDVIAPAYWLRQSMGERGLETLLPHAFEAIRPELHRIVQPGDVFVVGRNFGAGSHREQAVLILQRWGVQAVVGDSLARIYFRNAIGAGLPAFNLAGVTGMFEEGDQIEIDMERWTVSNPARGWSRDLQPFPPTVLRILEAGGIPALVKARVEQQLAVKAGLAE